MFRNLADFYVFPPRTDPNVNQKKSIYQVSVALGALQYWQRNDVNIDGYEQLGADAIWGFGDVREFVMR